MEDISDKILLYLYKFRNDSDFHDLFDVFDQTQVDVVFDKANDLYNGKFIDIQAGIYFGNEPPKEKQDYFARITQRGKDYVKNEIIRQAEIDKLTRDKEERDKKYTPLNIILTALLVIVAIYSAYQTDKTSTLTQDKDRLIKENNKLSADKDSLQRLLTTTEQEILELQQADSSQSN